MIRISNKYLETPIVLEPSHPFILSVENSKEFYKFVTDLNNAF